MQAMLQIVYGQVAVTIETDQIVSVPFMIPEKEILAMFRPVVAPMCLGLFDSWRGRMVIDLVLDAVVVQEVEYDRFPFHVVVIILRKGPVPSGILLPGGRC